MNPYLAYFLGVFTIILILLVSYILARSFDTFRAGYSEIVCKFPSDTKELK